MQILTQTKPQVDAELGSAVMTPDLIGGFSIFDGESAFSYDSGPFEIIVGFFPAGAKYVAIRDSSGSPLTQTEIQSIQGFLSPTGTWSSTNDNFTCNEGTPGKLSAMGYYSETKGYFFAYVPGLLVSRSQIDAQMPDGVAHVKPRPNAPGNGNGGQKPQQPTPAKNPSPNVPHPVAANNPTRPSVIQPPPGGLEIPPHIDPPHDGQPV